jgi:hypothetical protein
MAINKIFAGNDGDNRARVVPSGTVSGAPLILSDRPAGALTDRGDATRTEEIAGVSITRSSAGVGLADDEASVAFSGTYEFPVAGAAVDTDDDVAVYITAGGALTLTDVGNTLFGYTDYPKGYRKEAGRAPVRIGA